MPQGFEWIVLLILLVIVLVSPVLCAVLGYKAGKKQGHEMVDGWSRGEALR